jgi:hypothetical protein
MRTFDFDRRALQPRSYVLTYDPTPVEDGGYRPGATFGQLDFSAYARGSFVPGTRFQGNGKEYVIDKRKWLVRV